MKSPKKFFLILAAASLVPLLMLFVFFVYRMGIYFKEKQNLQGNYLYSRQQVPKVALEQLAEGLSQQLRQTGGSTAHGSTAHGSTAHGSTAHGSTDEEPGFSREQVGYIKKFQLQHPEFEEIILKNPQTGAIYLALPAEAQGDAFIGVHLMVTVPVPTDSQTILLMGFINLNQPTQAVSQKKKAKKTAGANPNKKIALLAAFFLAFVVMAIPVAMFFFYRKLKRVASDPSRLSTKHITRRKK